jgi:hypothetical protein
MTTTEFLRALAMTESLNCPDVMLGDGGRAAGRYQMHPDWVFWASQHYHITPHLNETWDSFFTRLVTAFYGDFVRYETPLVIAMRFHIGHLVPSPSSPNWDEAYAKRFLSYCPPKAEEA